MFAKRKQVKAARAEASAALGEARSLAAALTEREEFSAEDFRSFVQFVLDHHLDIDDLATEWRAVRVWMAHSGCFIEMDSPLLLQDGERCIGAGNVSLMKEVNDRRLVGSSQGVSVPLGHGARYRVGAYRGHMVTVGSHLTVADRGVLTLTRRRVVFSGDRRTIEFPLAKLTTVRLYSDGIALAVSSRQTVSTFGTGDPELWAGLIHSAFAHRDRDVTIIQMETTPA